MAPVVGSKVMPAGRSGITEKEKGPVPVRSERAGRGVSLRAWARKMRGVQRLSER